jgi:uncharacterized protein (DUF697 family)
MLVVESHTSWAATAGFLPVPGADVLAIFAVQLRMISRLGAVYGVPFREQAARSAIAALMAGILQRAIAGGVASGLKLVPGIGTLLGIAAQPGLAYAGTYAIGRVFIMHFESGGTYFDFDPSRMREQFRRQFEAARGNKHLAALAAEA